MIVLWSIKNKLLTLIGWIGIPGCPELHNKEGGPAYGIDQHNDQSHLHCFGHSFRHTCQRWRDAARWNRGISEILCGVIVPLENRVIIRGLTAITVMFRRWDPSVIGAITVRLGSHILARFFTAIWWIRGFVAVRMRVAVCFLKIVSCFPTPGGLRSDRAGLLFENGKVKKHHVLLHICRNHTLWFQVDVVMDLSKYPYLLQKPHTYIKIYLLIYDGDIDCWEHIDVVHVHWLLGNLINCWKETSAHERIWLLK